VNPIYPLYIVSKGRWDVQMTSQALDALGIPHHVIVEADQLDRYRAHGMPSATYLVLDPEYQRTYDRLLPADDPSSPGSGPARNFAWNHSIATYGSKRHWVMDDNIQRFHRFNRNLKTPVVDGTIFRCMESFVDRYANVAMAGPNYFMFAVRKSNDAPPFYLNTRIYSCNLILNDLPFRWRGRYNEDTILSLDLLKAGWCTILFNAFLQYKMTTQTMKGGNTTELYGSGTLAKSQMLVAAHGDVAKHSFRFSRDHHSVDYGDASSLQTAVLDEGVWDVAKDNHLILRDDAVVPDGVDNFGMILERLDPQTQTWVRMDTPWWPWEDGR